MDEPLLRQHIVMTEADDAYVSAADRLHDIDIGGIEDNDRSARISPSLPPYPPHLFGSPNVNCCLRGLPE